LRRAAISDKSASGRNSLPDKTAWSNQETRKALMDIDLVINKQYFAVTSLPLSLT
jgi:hypothetical protein